MSKFDVSRSQLDYRNNQPYGQMNALEQSILNYQKEGWVLLNRTGSTAQLHKPKGNPSCSLVVILLLLGILPGIIYLLLHAVISEESVLLFVDPQSGIVQQTLHGGSNNVFAILLMLIIAVVVVVVVIGLFAAIAGN